MKKHIRFIILGINICVLVANIALLVSVRTTRQAILLSANDEDAAKPTHAIEDPLGLPIHPFGATLPSSMQRGFCGEMLSEEAYSFRENNLIDATFARYWSLPPSNLEEKVMVAQYAECWKKEAKHALALLYKGANPYFLDYVPSVNELADSFDAFAEVNSSLYANFVYSHTFRPTNGVYDEAYSHGSGLPGGYSISRAAHYRAFAFYLYDLLAANYGTPKLLFQPEEFEAEWGYLAEQGPDKYGGR